jgi:signal-transduction protein with cAMP-binding, CBS, and nucleotidyltransferase domain
MLVEAIMQTGTATVDRDHTALRVARLMKEKNVGSVVVVDDKGRPVGIVTDRDLALKLMAEGKSPETPVDEIMSHPVFAVSQASLVFDTLREMARRHVHRMPVIDAETKKLVGVVTAEAALMLLTTELANIAEVMSHARPSRGA